MKLDDLAAHPAIAAAAGSLIGLWAFPGASAPMRLANAFAGFIIAIFIGSAVVEHLAITSLRVQSAVVFMVGSTGLVMFGAIVEGIRKTDLAGWLRGLLPGGKSSKTTGDNDAP